MESFEEIIQLIRNSDHAIIAVTGIPGSGKSTFINLVIGFLRPTSGSIKLDGQDMATIDLRTSRKFLSVVAQDTILFDGTVYENVTYGMSNPTAVLADALLFIIE